MWVNVADSASRTFNVDEITAAAVGYAIDQKVSFRHYHSDVITSGKLPGAAAFMIIFIDVVLYSANRWGS
jgi:hypothetical protein